jgi:hypothetical protein
LKPDTHAKTPQQQLVRSIVLAAFDASLFALSIFHAFAIHQPIDPHSHS